MAQSDPEVQSYIPASCSAAFRVYDDCVFCAENTCCNRRRPRSDSDILSVLQAHEKDMLISGMHCSDCRDAVFCILQVKNRGKNESNSNSYPYMGSNRIYLQQGKKGRLCSRNDRHTADCL